MNSIKQYFRHIRFPVLGAAVLCLALGVVVLLWPGDTLRVLCIGFGAVLILSGLLQLASYFLGEKSSVWRRLLILSGIISIVVGVWILLGPDKVLRLVSIVLGVVLLYHGFADIRFGMDIKKCGGKSAATVVLFGLLTCALGVLILVDPFEGEKLLMLFMGLSFLFDGATDTYTVFALAKAEKQYDALASAEPVIEMPPASAEIVPENKN